MSALDAALDYAARGWRVSPWSTARDSGKYPLTEHGRSDATADEVQLAEWFGRLWPNALVGVATGPESGVVALDVDVSPDCSGFDSLEELGVAMHPETMTAHTPRGGVHMLFKHPGHYVKTIADKLGRGLDIRGDGGSLILPPGPGRFWDEHLGVDTPLADMPEWMLIPEPEPAPMPTGPRPGGNLSRYGEAALDNAVKRIIEAGPGAQETTLNGEAFGIGQLAGANIIPPGFALDGLLWAARRMPSYDPRRPWRPVDLDRKVKMAFTDGIREPRTVPSA